MFKVRFAPAAQRQLVVLYEYIAASSTVDTAARYTNALIDKCESMQTFPHRGILRDDIRPGMRITNFRKRTGIAFLIEGNTVVILGIFHGGRSYETLLQDEDESI
jgi:plasmid stabilization system protein ParE